MKLKNLSAAFFAAVSVALVVLASGIVAQADTVTHPNASGVGSTTINMDFVNVGNAGNTADDTGYGAVGYNYRIGAYEVTADQWAAVLAAAPSVGNAGNWSGSQPTAGTSWYEAAKFCNWLTTGDVNSGVYNTTTWDIMDHQTAGTTYGTAYFIPTEDEWYKAAYHKNNGVTGGAANCWDYPTGSDSVPTAVYGGTAAGTAVFYDLDGVVSPNAPANVDNSGGLSPYGTMGQGGNVWEWNEALIVPSRGLRGGGFHDSSYGLRASLRDSYYPAYEDYRMGFRVASVPEPGSITLLVCGAIAGLMWRWRRRKNSM